MMNDSIQPDHLSLYKLIQISTLNIYSIKLQFASPLYFLHAFNFFAQL